MQRFKLGGLQRLQFGGLQRLKLEGPAMVKVEELAAVILGGACNLVDCKFVSPLSPYRSPQIEILPFF